MRSGAGPYTLPRSAVASLGVLQRLDARAKIVGFVALVVVIVSTPARAVWAFAAYAMVLAFLVAFSRVPLRQVLKRVLVVIPFVLLVAVFLPFFDRAGSGGYSVGGSGAAGGMLVLWNVGAKAVLGVLSVILLTSTTSFPEVLAGLQRLRVPQVFVLVVSFMYRYSFVFIEEFRRMQRAMASRNYRARWLWNAPTLARMLSSLFLRSYGRGERVYVAMVSRGYQGGIALSSPSAFGLREAAFLGLLLLTAMAIRVAAAL